MKQKLYTFFGVLMGAWAALSGIQMPVLAATNPNDNPLTGDWQGQMLGVVTGVLVVAAIVLVVMYVMGKKNKGKKGAGAAGKAKKADKPGQDKKKK